MALGHASLKPAHRAEADVMHRAAQPPPRFLAVKQACGSQVKTDKGLVFDSQDRATRQREGFSHPASGERIPRDEPRVSHR